MEADETMFRPNYLPTSGTKTVIELPSPEIATEFDPILKIEVKINRIKTE